MASVTGMNARSMLVVKRRREDDRSESDQTIKSKPKKKKKKKTLRRRAGSLEPMFDMPLDVLFECFGYLEPKDLLHLSWTSKNLREILMSCSSITVWQQARSHIDWLPDCPQGLSEPQYAKVIFDSSCHYCGVKNAKSSREGLLPVRCCSKCCVDQLLCLKIKEAIVAKLQMPNAILELLPHAGWSLDSQMLYSIQNAGMLMEEYKTIETEDLRNAWLSAKAAALNMATLRSNIIDQAQEARVKQHDCINKRLRTKRCEMIIAKLKDLGWEEELNTMHPADLYRHAEMKKAKALTDRTWGQMEDSMIELMQRHKNLRLANERRKVIEGRCGTMKHFYKCFRFGIITSTGLNIPYPEIGVFAEKSPFTELIFNHDIAGNQNDFEVAFRNSHQHITSWFKETLRELGRVLQRSSIGNNASFVTLSLATTFFKCATCNFPIGYPRIMVHSCSQFGVDPLQNDDMKTMLRFFDTSRSCSETISKITFHEEAHRNAMAILKALALPDDTIASDIEGANPFLEYLGNIPSDKSVMARAVMRWSAAIFYPPALVVAETQAYPWRKLNLQDENRAAQAERENWAILVQRRRRRFPELLPYLKLDYGRDVQIAMASPRYLY
ncbi:hypothetical protein B0H34DRAFT_794600 [Crassisporium funariophilum]|nr:hypothetical protein B0H34DRAFT_794600 [Crassisporium funariophilum]